MRSNCLLSAVCCRMPVQGGFNGLHCTPLILQVYKKMHVVDHSTSQGVWMVVIVIAIVAPMVVDIIVMVLILIRVPLYPHTLMTYPTLEKD